MNKIIPADESSIGWTTNVELLEQIKKDVQHKSGGQIYLEQIDDVIISLQNRGYVTVEHKFIPICQKCGIEGADLYNPGGYLCVGCASVAQQDVEDYNYD